MSGTNDFRIPQNFEDWMRYMEKRLQRQERRLGSASAGTVTGEGLTLRIPPPPAGEPPGATEPPAASPSLKTSGNANGVTVIADGTVDPSSTLDYYIDDVLVESTRAQVVHFTTDGAGAPLMAGVTYSFTVVARNDLGSAPPSDAVPGELNSGVSSEFITGLVYAGGAFFGSVSIGNITIDPDEGFVSPQANNGLVHIPANGVDPVSLIKVGMEADWATFNGKVTIKHEDNVIEGGFTLANGVTPPLAGPSVAADWGPVLAQLEALPSGVYNFNYGSYLTGNQLYRCVFHSQTSNNIYQFNLSTGALANTISLGSFEATSLTQIAGNWYVCGYDNARSGRTFVYAYDSSWSKTAEFEFTRVGLGPLPPYISANGASTTTVRITYTTEAGGSARFHSQAYTIATGATSGSALAINTTNLYGISGAYYGTADFGATRLVIDRMEGSTLVYDTSGVQHENFNPITNHEALMWDGSYFYGIDTSGQVYRYSDVIVPITRSVRFTWYDNDSAGSGTHETTTSQATSFSQAARRWIRVTTPAPDDQGGADDPNAVRIYLQNDRQADLGTGVTTAIYGVGDDFGDPPTSNNFPLALVPGYMQSKITDGTSPLTKFDGAGAARIAKLSQSGTVTITHSSGTSASQAVTFPVPFSTTPRILVAGRTTNPDAWRVSYSSESTTGVTIHASRTTTPGTITVSWLATTAW